jgi:NTE family protein
MSSLGVMSKLNADWAFLQELRDVGRETASRWLDENFDAIGQRSTTDLRDLFL